MACTKGVIKPSLVVHVQCVARLRRLYDLLGLAHAVGVFRECTLQGTVQLPIPLCREHAMPVIVNFSLCKVISKLPQISLHILLFIIIIIIIIDRSIYAGSIKASSALQRIQNRTEIT